MPSRRAGVCAVGVGPRSMRDSRLYDFEVSALISSSSSDSSSLGGSSLSYSICDGVPRSLPLDDVGAAGLLRSLRSCEVLAMAAPRCDSKASANPVTGTVSSCAAPMRPLAPYAVDWRDLTLGSARGRPGPRCGVSWLTTMAEAADWDAIERAVEPRRVERRGVAILVGLCEEVVGRLVYGGRGW